MNLLKNFKSGVRITAFFFFLTFRQINTSTQLICHFMSCPQVFHHWHSKCVVLKLQPLIFFNHSILLFLCPKYRYQLSVKSSLWSLSADYLCMKFIKQEPLKNLHHKINFIFQFEIKTCSHKLMHKKNCKVLFKYYQMTWDHNKFKKTTVDSPDLVTENVKLK